jgi:CheY-like chemotaxis protein
MLPEILHPRSSDEHPAILMEMILHRLLRDLAHNHALIAVNTGQAALSNMALCAVPLLITDFNMLGMDGIQLITAAKKTSPQTRTVLITAAEIPASLRAVQAGPVGR